MKRLTAILLLLAVAFCCVSCGKVVQRANEPISGTDVSEIDLPADFTFSIVWGCYGISSYDSQTGKLVKTNDATDVTKYTAYVKLSENELKLVYKYLCLDLHLADYPAEYDPFNAPHAIKKVWSNPSQTIVLSVTANGQTHTVTCNDVALGTINDGYCRDAKMLLQAKNNVVTLLTSLPEWQAFPDYEFFYD